MNTELKNLFCEVCGKKLQGLQQRLCSYECKKSDLRQRYRNDTEYREYKQRQALISSAKRRKREVR